MKARLKTPSPASSESGGNNMACTGKWLKGSLLVAVIMMAVSCGGSVTSSSSTSQGVTSASTSSSSAPHIQVLTDKLNGGLYRFGPFGDKRSVTIVATGPKGWVGYPDWAMDGPEPVRADAPRGLGVALLT